MTDSKAGAPAPGGRGSAAPSYPRRLLGALAITQTVGYGVLFYCFSVFLTPIAASLHASTTAVTGALTVSLLAGAGSAVPVGRWLDRHGGRSLMTVGSALGTVLVVVWSRVTSLAELYAVWVGIGVVSAMVLYEAAFAVVIPLFAAERRNRALLTVTVIAGFSSSIFLPLAGYLLGEYGWRTSVLLLAAVHGAITIPLHLLIRAPAKQSALAKQSASDQGAGPDQPADPAAREHRRALLRSALHDRVYWISGFAFVAQGSAVAAISVLLVTCLRAYGHSAGFAANTAGLLGILSVTGRLLFTAGRRSRPPVAIAAIVFTVQAFGAALLPVFGRSDAGAVGCVLAFGLGFGVATLTRPALLADRYGTSAYATLSGTMAVPLTIVKALAPLGAAALAGAQDSFTPVLAASAIACLVGAGALTIAAKAGPLKNAPHRESIAA